MKLRLALAVLLLAVPSLAQYQWLPLGSLVSSGQDTIAGASKVEFDLGFPFTMPGGAVTSVIEVGNLGSFTAADGNLCCSNCPAHTLINQLDARVFVFNAHHEFLGADAGVFGYTDGATVAAVTWTGVQTATVPSTFQVQLYADGRVVMLYDSSCNNTGTCHLIGLAPGSGAPVPATTDFTSVTAAGPYVVADTTVYQDQCPSGTISLAGSALEFAPIGAGGASGWTITRQTGLADPEFARTRSEATSGCFQKVSYTFAPDGVGGYDVTSGPSQYDPVVGALAGVTGNVVIHATNLDLGFPMLFPDGNTYQFVDIDPSGRILPTGMAGTVGDWMPSEHVIQNAGYPFFFGLWTDWDVLGPGADGVYFKTAPGSATFTWRDVPQDWSSFHNGGGMMQPCTWQITLLQGGTVVITHEDLRGLNPSIRGLNAADGYIHLEDTAVGITSGQPHATGEIDLSMMSSAPSNVPGYAYEHWDCSANPQVGSTVQEPVDLLLDTADLVGFSMPVLGGAWELQVQDVGSAAFGFYVVGTTAANSDLTLLGSPCVRRVALDLTEFRLADGLGGLQPWTLAIPSTPSLVGVTLFAQGVVQEPIGGSYGSFLGLPFGTSWTNPVRGTLGG
ncbi:MAG: hypothetical protein KAI24_23815 [Planctomycetes bacterium]|nr:hypothetical protein [Planctomycetota bacterium]